MTGLFFNAEIPTFLGQCADVWDSVWMFGTVCGCLGQCADAWDSVRMGHAPFYLAFCLPSQFPVLGTCATFSATGPLVRSEKGGARRSGTKVKNNGAVAVARKKWR